MKEWLLVGLFITPNLSRANQGTITLSGVVRPNAELAVTEHGVKIGNQSCVTITNHTTQVFGSGLVWSANFPSHIKAHSNNVFPLKVRAISVTGGSGQGWKDIDSIDRIIIDGILCPSGNCFLQYQVDESASGTTVVTYTISAE